MKTVKVHDDTHRALKRLKAKRRSRSVDQVIRDMIRASGASTDEPSEGDEKLTSYAQG